MSYKVPSRRHSKKEPQRLNLIPILDAVFIFIFFLLMSAQFIKIFEINSDVPIVSDAPPPKDQKDPLALTLTITNAGFAVSTGVPSRTVKKIPKQDGLYDLTALHNFLVDLKKQHVKEKSIIFIPKVDIEYEIIVQIMDAVRMLKNTDDAELFIKDKDGVDVKVKELFNQIVFGNLMS